MTIYWAISGPKCGGRKGTVLPHRGESWAHMVRSLQQTEPKGFLTAYRYNSKGDSCDYSDLDFETEDATQAESWFSNKLTSDTVVGT